MIDKFRIGKYYLYVGDRTMGWNKEGGMDFVLDRKPHKCVDVDPANASSAVFEDQEDFINKEGDNFGKYMWMWTDLSSWYEVNIPVAS